MAINKFDAQLANFIEEITSLFFQIIEDYSTIGEELKEFDIIYEIEKKIRIIYTAGNEKKEKEKLDTLEHIRAEHITTLEKKMNNKFQGQFLQMYGIYERNLNLLIENAYEHNPIVRDNLDNKFYEMGLEPETIEIKDTKVIRKKNFIITKEELQDPQKRKKKIFEKINDILSTYTNYFEAYRSLLAIDKNIYYDSAAEQYADGILGNRDKLTILTEARERRNLILHRSSVIDKKYISQIKQLCRKKNTLVDFEKFISYMFLSNSLLNPYIINPTSTPAPNKLEIPESIINKELIDKYLLDHTIPSPSIIYIENLFESILFHFFNLYFHANNSKSIEENFLNITQHLLLSGTKLVEKNIDKEQKARFSSSALISIFEITRKLFNQEFTYKQKLPGSDEPFGKLTGNSITATTWEEIKPIYDKLNLKTKLYFMFTSKFSLDKNHIGQNLESMNKSLKECKDLVLRDKFEWYHTGFRDFALMANLNYEINNSFEELTNDEKINYLILTNKFTKASKMILKSIKNTNNIIKFRTNPMILFMLKFGKKSYPELEKLIYPEGLS